MLYDNHHKKIKIQRKIKQAGKSLFLQFYFPGVTSPGAGELRSVWKRDNSICYLAKIFNISFYV